MRACLFEDKLFVIIAVRAAAASASRSLFSVPRIPRAEREERLRSTFQFFKGYTCAPRACCEHVWVKSHSWLETRATISEALPVH